MPEALISQIGPGYHLFRAFSRLLTARESFIFGRRSRIEWSEEMKGGAPMIKKVKNKYVVLSELTGRSFGTYNTKAEAERRLRQVEFFKHAKGGKHK